MARSASIWPVDSSRRASRTAALSSRSVSTWRASLGSIGSTFQAQSARPSHIRHRE